jgi:hypothetical protein
VYRYDVVVAIVEMFSDTKLPAPRVPGPVHVVVVFGDTVHAADALMFPGVPVRMVNCAFVGCPPVVAAA